MGICTRPFTFDHSYAVPSSSIRKELASPALVLFGLCLPRRRPMPPSAQPTMCKRDRAGRRLRIVHDASEDARPASHTAIQNWQLLAATQGAGDSLWPIHDFLVESRLARRGQAARFCRKGTSIPTSTAPARVHRLLRKISGTHRAGQGRHALALAKLNRMPEATAARADAGRPARAATPHGAVVARAILGEPDRGRPSPSRRRGPLAPRSGAPPAR